MVTGLIPSRPNLQPSNRGRRYCELQILFDATAGESHYRRYSADDPDTLPWQEILALTNLLLEEKVADVAGLRENVVISKNKKKMTVESSWVKIRTCHKVLYLYYVYQF